MFCRRGGIRMAVDQTRRNPTVSEGVKTAIDYALPYGRVTAPKTVRSPKNIAHLVRQFLVFQIFRFDSLKLLQQLPLLASKHRGRNDGN
jgi:hypothetical protein